MFTCSDPFLMMPVKSRAPVVIILTSVAESILIDIRLYRAMAFTIVADPNCSTRIITSVAMMVKV